MSLQRFFLFVFFLVGQELNNITLSLSQNKKKKSHAFYGVVRGRDFFFFLDFSPPWLGSQYPFILNNKLGSPKGKINEYQFLGSILLAFGSFFLIYSSPHFLTGHLRVTHIAKGSKERLGEKKKKKPYK